MIIGPGDVGTKFAHAGLIRGTVMTIQESSCITYYIILYSPALIIAITVSSPTEKCKQVVHAKVEILQLVATQSGLGERSLLVLQLQTRQLPKTNAKQRHEPREFAPQLSRLS